jgi:Domain of unknown function (DUF4340)
MNPRVTWLLVLVALGLGGYLFVSERRGAVTVSGNDGAQVSFLPILPEQVTAVELLRSNGVVRVERAGGAWNLRLPVAYAAQGQAVDALLNALAQLRPQSWISPAQTGGDESLKAFGLDASAATLKLETAGAPLLFKLGASAPLGHQFYFQRIGDAGVFTAADSLLDLLPASPNAWRDRSLVDLGKAPFDRFELRGKTAFEAVRDPATGVWRLTKPLSARADSDRINSVLHTLQSVRVAQFVTDNPLADLEPYGLRPPETEALISLGTNVLAQLQFGRAPTNQAGVVYARRLAQTNVVLVPAAVTNVLHGALGTFRDHRLLPALDGVTRFEITVGNDHAVAEKSGTNWRVTQPASFPAEAALLDQLMSQFSQIAITDYPNDVVADYGVYGLAAPVRSYTFARGTNAPLQLQFGARADADHIFVRRPDEAGVYAVRLSELLQLPETANQLRDFHFAASNVVKVAITQKGNTRTLERGTDGQWAVTAGAPGSPFSPAVEESLHRLGALQTGRAAVRDEAQYTRMPSFSDLGHEITLTFAPGAGGTLHTLRLRFVADQGPEAFALANFDADPSPVLIRIPAALFLDLRRDFSVF